MGGHKRPNKVRKRAGNRVVSRKGRAPPIGFRQKAAMERKARKQKGFNEIMRLFSRLADLPGTRQVFVREIIRISETYKIPMDEIKEKFLRRVGDMETIKAIDARQAYLKKRRASKRKK